MDQPDHTYERQLSTMTSSKAAIPLSADSVEKL
jgi:hypothetical protein